MATIVGGFLMPHDPLITANPEAADAEPRGRVMNAFATISKRIGQLRATTAIILGDDHYANFGPGCLPSFLIATGEVEGPLEPWLRIERRPVENNRPLAEHIRDEGFARGFDWAVAKVFTLDHSTMVPFHLVVSPHPGIKTIPIYLAAGVEPLLRPRRAYELGRLVRSAVESWNRDERVVILGTGGMSHWVGTKEMGRVNESFDRMILSLVEKGDVETLLGFDDDYILENGGNGALEIRNWICALGAMSGANRAVKGQAILYEPVPPWIAGLGFAELRGA